MDALLIHGGSDLSGELQTSGSKNASLAIMAAALLARGESILKGVPELADVRNLGRALEYLGAKVIREGESLYMHTEACSSRAVPSALTCTLRASILVLGPLLALFGHAKVSSPGGCAIGKRPIDQHVKGLEALGASVLVEHGYIIAHACHGLRGAKVLFDIPTVTGTMNLMMAASLAHGVTVLSNAAREPEVDDLAACLVSMGSVIEGVGTDEITIYGRRKLLPYKYKVMSDRIECGTFLVAGALKGNPLTVKGCIYEHQAVLVEKLRAIGARIEVAGDSITIYKALRPRALDVCTGPFPGFPTDMQPQLMALLCIAEGTTILTETLFEKRFMHVASLKRLGADITIVSDRAIIHGVPTLSGSTVVATDLRASASLVLAGLVAKGSTTVRCITHMDRGFDSLDSKLAAVGACISRFKE